MAVANTVPVEKVAQKAFDSLLRTLGHSSIRDAERIRDMVEEYRSSGGVVVKVGGSALSEQCGPSIFDSIRVLDGLRIPLVIVHGGGKEIDEEMGRRGIDIIKDPETGQRVTNEDTVEVLKAVMPRIGLGITNSLIQENIDAQQMLGHGGVLKVMQVSETLQYVGRITRVKAGGILALAREGMVVVVTPLGYTSDHVYNINADLAASSIACALSAKRIVFVTNVNGINDGRRWREEIRVWELKGMVRSGSITGGMIPKIEAATEAVAGGVSASIVNGKTEGSVLKHLFGSNGSGTEITR